MNPLFILLLLFTCITLSPAPVLADPAAIPSQEITISFDLEQGSMQGQSRLTLPPNQSLQLYFGDLENIRITAMAGDSKKQLTPDNKTLTLPAVGQQQIIRISWRIHPKDGGYRSGNLIQKKGITLTGLWHPLTGQDMLFSLTAVLPPGFSGITGADKLISNGRGKNRQIQAAYPHPRQSINFAAGPYVIKSRKAGKTKVYTYFFKEDAGLAADYLDRAVAYIQRYEKLLGAFPFQRYSIVENRLPTGYGMPAFTLLGQAVIRLPFIKESSLGHEILHSWFGNAVQLDKTGNWCEGLTSYLADQTYAEEQGKGVAYRKNQLLRYQAYVHKDNITALIDFQNGGDSQPMAQKMRVIGYNKAAMLFHSLRLETGDATFFAALKTISSEYRFKKIGWTDIETVFSKAAGRDLHLFFGQWLLRRDIPAFSAERISVDQQKGSSLLSFHIVQENEAPYRLQIPLIIQTRNGEKKETVQVDSLDQEVSVTVDSLPTELILDPEYTLMRQLLPEEKYPAWSQLLGAGQKTVVLPQKEEMEKYMPLVADLERMGCRLSTAAELKNSELLAGSFVFLGSSAHTSGLFANAFGHYPEKGFTLEVRKNPLNPEQVMVLVSSSSTDETSRAVRKLSHYGRYSYLSFKKGIIQEKRIQPSENGIKLELIVPPAGIPVQQVQDFSAIVDDILQSRVIYVGEMHTDYGSHLLQLQVIQAMFEKISASGNRQKLAIGMEMFPRSAQQALDDYINGAIDQEAEFLKRSQYFKVWGYDYRFYREIIGYARAHAIPLVGLNLEKKIVSTVFKKGDTDELTGEQLDQVAAERDLQLPGYRKRLQAVHSMHGKAGSQKGFAGFLQAQSFWDETMAESITGYLRQHPDTVMVVIAGTGHVYRDNAIPPRVERRMKVRQSVLIGENSMNRGMETGKRADYLMFTESINLPPAGKIGVVLQEKEDKDTGTDTVHIIRLSPHGKAGKAGLKKGDIILSIDDFPVTSVADLKAVLMNRAPGETVSLNIRRAQQTMTIRVELSNMAKAGMKMPPGHPQK
jgi:uncharacterized iron-regulated protein